MITAAKSRNKARSSRRSVRRKRKTCGLKLGMEVEPSSAGFHQWFTTKPLEVPWLSQKPSPEARCGGGDVQAGLTAQEGRSDRVGAVRPPRRDGQTAWLARRREGPKRRTRGRIAWLASRLSKVRCSAVRLMKKISSFQNCPRGACIDSRALYSFATSPGPDIYWRRVEMTAIHPGLGFSFAPLVFSFIFLFSRTSLRAS